MPNVVYAVLEETPLGACVSDVFRERADALTAAENAARQKAADMRTADAASSGAYVGSSAYVVLVEDRGSRGERSIVHTRSGEVDPSFRWRVLEHEVVETMIASLARPTATVT